MSDSNPSPLSAEETRNWNQEQYLAAMKYCQKHQLPIGNFDKKESRVLPPVLAVWKVHLDTKPAQSIWVIGGEVLMDHVDASVSPDARSVLRHFSLTWQMKATQLENALQENSSGNLDKEQQQKVISTLIEKAEALYELAENKDIWG